MGDRADKPARRSTAARTSGVSYDRLVELGVVRDEDPESVRRLYRGRDGWPAELAVLDFLTIRDLARRGEGVGGGCGGGDQAAGDPRLHALLMALMLARDSGSVGLCVEK